MTTKNNYIHGHSDAFQAAFQVVRRASRWLLVVASIPFGMIGAAIALLATIAATGSLALAACVGALAAVLLTGGLSWLAMRGISRGRWLPGITTGITLVIVALLVSPVVFAPAPSYTPSPQLMTRSTGNCPLARGLHMCTLPPKVSPSLRR
jgi:amino acid transporter